MSRPMRIEYPGAIYHITARGNAKNAIFHNNNDRNSFFDILTDVTKRCNWLCHSYCLMSNHYHLLIETIEANLSYGMRQLNGVYSQRFNIDHSRVGHLFQGRFKAIIVDRENYLLELCRYIVLNPVRAKIVSKPENYAWSSYRATMKLQECPNFLTIDWILKQFSKKIVSAREKYSEFVYAGIGKDSPWSNLRGQIILGREDFLQTIEALIEEKSDVAEIPRIQRLVLQQPPVDLFDLHEKAKQPAARNKIIRELHYKNGLATNKIAKIFSLHPGTISKIINQEVRCKT